MKLDAYTIQDYIVDPVSVTIMDESERLLSQITFDENAGKEGLIKAEDVYIGNLYSKNEFVRADSSLYELMKLTYQGERKTDKKAAKERQKIAEGKNKDAEKNETYTEKVSYGFGRFTVTKVDIAGDYSMITVNECIYLKSVIWYMSLLFLVWTLAYGILNFCRKRKNSD